MVQQLKKEATVIIMVDIRVHVTIIKTVNISSMNLALGYLVPRLYFSQAVVSEFVTIRDDYMFDAIESAANYYFPSCFLVWES